MSGGDTVFNDSTFPGAVAAGQSTDPRDHLPSPQRPQYLVQTYRTSSPSPVQSDWYQKSNGALILCQTHLELITAPQFEQTGRLLHDARPLENGIGLLRCVNRFQEQLVGVQEFIINLNSVCPRTGEQILELMAFELDSLKNRTIELSRVLEKIILPLSMDLEELKVLKKSIAKVSEKLKDSVEGLNEHRRHTNGESAREHVEDACDTLARTFEGLDFSLRTFTIVGIPTIINDRGAWEKRVAYRLAVSLVFSGVTAIALLIVWHLGTAGEHVKPFFCALILSIWLVHVGISIGRDPPRARMSLRLYNWAFNLLLFFYCVGLLGIFDAPRPTR